MKAVLALVALFCLLITPTQAFVFVSMSLPEPVYYNSPSMMAISFNAQQPVFLPSQAASVNVATNFPQPVFASSPIFHASASVNMPSADFGKAEFGASIDTHLPGMNIQEPNTKIDMRTNTPLVPSGPTQLPSAAMTTNFQPQYGSEMGISVSVPQRTLLTGYVSGSGHLPYRNMDADFPCLNRW